MSPGQRPGLDARRGISRDSVEIAGMAAAAFHPDLLAVHPYFETAIE